MPDDWIWYLLLIPAGFAAGVVNTIAGGGSFLTLPALMAVGLPVQIANGSNRIAILLQCGLAASIFKREGHVDTSRTVRYLIPSMVGVIFGVWLATQMSDVAFEKIFGLIFLVMSVVFLFKPKILLASERQPLESRGLEILVFFTLGFYGGFIQAGAGVLLLMAMTVFSAQRLVSSNGIKLVLIGAWQIIAIVGYAWADQIDWFAGLLLACGNVPGAIVGTKLALRKGDKLIFIAMIVVMVATGIKMLVW